MGSVKNKKRAELEEKVKKAYKKGKELKKEKATSKKIKSNQKKVKILENKLAKVTKDLPKTHSKALDNQSSTRKIEKSKFKTVPKSYTEESDIASVEKVLNKIKKNESSVDFIDDIAIDKIINTNSLNKINSFINKETRTPVLEAAEYRLLLLKLEED